MRATRLVSLLLLLQMRGQLTVLSPGDYAAWVKQASELARRAYDAEDRTAHWAWNWERGVK